MRVSLAFGLIAILCWVAASQLQLFGQGYADQATTALHILTLGIFPMILGRVIVAIHRVAATRGRAAIVSLGTLLSSVEAPSARSWEV